MISFKKMEVYRLHRSNEEDHEGRPAIFLNFFGKESLVWFSTTNLSENKKDQPVILRVNNKTMYFYNKGIVKVKTNNIIGKWYDNKNNKIIKISDDIQKQLINKFVEFTNQRNPYEIIKNLEEENNLLKNKIFSLENNKNINFER